MRLYDYLKPRVIKELSKTLSEIHLSFDGWTTKSGKRGFLKIVSVLRRHPGQLKEHAYCSAAVYMVLTWGEDS